MNHELKIMNYITPAVSVEDAAVTVCMLASSGLKSDIGIDYGGVDGSGDKSAGAKEQSWDDIWD